VSTPQSRWQLAGERTAFYGTRFAALVASGQDIDGEARLADALLPRGARVLDAGAGMGRVAAALAARGHDVLAVEPDGALVAQARTTYPELAVEQRDILTLAPADGPFDLVVCVGNVMVFLAEDTERDALRSMASVLAEGGRILVGFHLQDPPEHARIYPPEQFEADVAAAGLRVDVRLGGYDLRRVDDAYGVWVLSRAGTV
jgi:SAM-dependent methyltransferase